MILLVCGVVSFPFFSLFFPLPAAGYKKKLCFYLVLWSLCCWLGFLFFSFKKIGHHVSISSKKCKFPDKASWFEADSRRKKKEEEEEEADRISL
jgi:hypothetical protein